jgi:protoporphyrinogen oxidase
MRKNRQTRICIVGAGAAGLTAAEKLKGLGYENVTILEKEPFAGGKCRTIEYEGRSYELGAGIVAANNRTVLNLAEKVGVNVAPVVYGSDNLYNIETGEATADILSAREQIPFLWQLLLRYRRLCHQYEQVQTPGFAGTDPALFQNFKDWADENGTELVGENFERFFTGFGYGYWEEIPTAYVLKYYDWETLKSYVRRGFFTFPEGIQTIWKKVAELHDVRYNTHIQSIVRNECVTVETNQGKLEFDEVLLSCPLDDALSFIDGSKLEKFLFSKICYYDYQTYACITEGFPQQTGFIPDHFRASKKGHPMFWYKRYDDSDLYTMYVLGDWQMTEAQIIGNIVNSIEKLGGKLMKVLSVNRWKYFPHVTTSDMQDGYFDKLESMQGTNRTYYIGELPNFSTVELTAAYAKDLTEKHF